MRQVDSGWRRNYRGPGRGEVGGVGGVGLERAADSLSCNVMVPSKSVKKMNLGTVSRGLRGLDGRGGRNRTLGSDFMAGRSAAVFWTPILYDVWKVEGRR